MRILLLAFAALLAPSGAGAADAPGTGKLKAYHDVIAPIFGSKCISCHGKDKAKGKLRMDSFEALMSGGSSGETIGPGDEDSELLYRIITEDEDDHMPPLEKAQLSEDEIEVIKWWVVSGAEKEIMVEDLAPDPALVEKIQAVVALSAGSPEDKAALAVNAEKAVAVAQKVSQALGAPITAIAHGSDKMQFDAVSVTKTFGDREIGELVPLGGALVEVNLARTQVTDEGLKTLGNMGSIRKLRLENTKVGDEGLKYLANLAQLEYLNLYGTRVTDAGIASLAKLKNLKKLFVWETGVTRGAAEKLIEQIPGLTINLGWDDEVSGSPPATKTAKSKMEKEKAS